MKAKNKCSICKDVIINKAKHSKYCLKCGDKQLKICKLLNIYKKYMLERHFPELNVRLTFEVEERC